MAEFLTPYVIDERRGWVLLEWPQHHGGPGDGTPLGRAEHTPEIRRQRAMAFRKTSTALRMRAMPRDPLATRRQ
jgi:hypothetical protein